MMRLDVSASIWSPDDSTRFAMNESVELEQMTFAQLARLLEAFHIIAEAVKESRNLRINDQELRYFG